MEPARNNARQFADRTWDVGWWLLDMEADGLHPIRARDAEHAQRQVLDFLSGK